MFKTTYLSVSLNTAPSGHLSCLKAKKFLKKGQLSAKIQKALYDTKSEAKVLSTREVRYRKGLPGNLVYPAANTGLRHVIFLSSSFKFEKSSVIEMFPI